MTTKEISSDATGGWIVYEETQDGRTATHFDTEPEAQWYMLTGQSLSAAEAARSLLIMQEETAESVILASIDKILPVFRGAFKELIGLQNDWLINGINTTIASAMSTTPPTDIENTPAWRLYAIGVIFTELFDFLNRLVPGIGMTPNQVLNLINWRNVMPPTAPAGIAQMPFEETETTTK